MYHLPAACEPATNSSVLSRAPGRAGSRTRRSACRRCSSTAGPGATGVRIGVPGSLTSRWSWNRRTCASPSARRRPGQRRAAERLLVLGDPLPVAEVLDERAGLAGSRSRSSPSGPGSARLRSTPAASSSTWSGVETAAQHTTPSRRKRSTASGEIGAVAWVTAATAARARASRGRSPRSRAGTRARPGSRAATASVSSRRPESGQ